MSTSSHWYQWFAKYLFHKYKFDSNNISKKNFITLCFALKENILFVVKISGISITIDRFAIYCKLMFTQLKSVHTQKTVLLWTGNFPINIDEQANNNICMWFEMQNIDQYKLFSIPLLQLQAKPSKNKISISLILNEINLSGTIVLFHSKASISILFRIVSCKCAVIPLVFVFLPVSIRVKFEFDFRRSQESQDCLLPFLTRLVLYLQVFLLHSTSVPAHILPISLSLSFLSLFSLSPLFFSTWFPFHIILCLSNLKPLKFYRK